jgi:hypothetical protein
MRILASWRFITIFLLLSGSFTVSAVADAHLVAATTDDDGDEQEKQEDKDEKREEKDAKEAEKQADKEEKEAEKEAKKANKVTETASYIVESACTFDNQTEITTCEFTGAAPDGAKKVEYFNLAADSVCTDVLDGTFEIVAPSTDSQVTGYRSTEKSGKDGAMTLLLEGEVSVAGQATYWFTTKDGVFPATGPGLSCNAPSADLSFAAETEPANDAPEATQAPTPTTVPTQDPELGQLAVITYTCVDVPADTTSFDWFGACEPGGAGLAFTLANATGTSSDPLTAATNDGGEAEFDSLAPGEWQLDSPDVEWCHAKSDSVTADSSLVVEAGETTSVWIFICDGGVK